MSLGKKLGVSMLNMGLQRALELGSSFLVTLFVIRALPRDEYGLLAIVLGYGLIFGALHIALSSVLLRDFHKVRPQIDRYIEAFYTFAYLKSAAAFVLTGILGWLLYRQYQSSSVVWTLVATTVTTVAGFYAEPAATLLSVDFRQHQLTKANLITSLVNVAVTLLAFQFPSAVFVAWKNAFVTVLGLVIVTSFLRPVFPIRLTPVWGSLRLVYECLLDYSLWSHLTGVMMDIVYRADLLILGWLNAPLHIVGNYNIALQTANLTKPLPQILQYHTTLGLGNAGDDQRRAEEMTFLFVKYSFVVSAAIYGGYVLFGRLIISILTPSDVEEIYRLGLFVLGGLCLFNGFRPLISYGFVREGIKTCFTWVILPTSLLTLLCYFVGARWAGVWGLATANVISGLASSLLTLLYIHKRTSFTWRFSWLSPAERDFLATVMAKTGLRRARSVRPDSGVKG